MRHEFQNKCLLWSIAFVWSMFHMVCGDSCLHSRAMFKSVPCVTPIDVDYCPDYSVHGVDHLVDESPGYLILYPLKGSISSVAFVGLDWIWEIHSTRALRGWLRACQGIVRMLFWWSKFLINLAVCWKMLIWMVHK